MQTDGLIIGMQPTCDGCEFFGRDLINPKRGICEHGGWSGTHTTITGGCDFHIKKPTKPNNLGGLYVGITTK